ncbi:MAG: hypothetical protein GX153_02435, partial [Clostridiaceae bacterium]|nr:hypothetical protein [Clostridiaceae bacterium]
AFRSTYGDNTVVVLHNLTGEQLSVDRAGLGVPVSAVSGYTVATGGKPRLTRDAVVLPPWSSTVLR